MLSSQFISFLEQLISEKTGKTVKHSQTRSLSGGCINNGFEFVSNEGSFFIKTNSASRFPGMFQAEATGLNLLAHPQCIRIPEVIDAGEFENTTFLILEFIQSTGKSADYWTDFGKKLATLHSNSAPQFGLDHDNYIGSLPQSNTFCSTWTDFMVSHRLNPLVKKAASLNLADSGMVRDFEKLYLRLDDLIPKEKPALLHGDLWSGNVMTGENGKVCLIDPAVYYGHREMDIAFSTLFGAFPQEFYHTYNDFFPLKNNWQQRIDLFNLYPLLVHLILFGNSYYGQIKNSLSKYL